MQRIDFLRPPQASRLGWALLALGATSLIASTTVVRRWEQQQVQADTELRQRAEAEQRQRLEALRPALTTPEQRRGQMIAPQLREPWLPTLRMLESVTEAPVYLIALAIEPAKGAIRIEGEAPNFGAALNYAQQLSESGVVEDALLLSHERGKDAAPDTGAVKFTVGARWIAR